MVTGDRKTEKKFQKYSLNTITQENWMITCADLSSMGRGCILVLFSMLHICFVFCVCFLLLHILVMFLISGCFQSTSSVMHGGMNQPFYINYGITSVCLCVFVAYQLCDTLLPCWSVRSVDCYHLLSLWPSSSWPLFFCEKGKRAHCYGLPTRSTAERLLKVLLTQPPQQPLQ